MEQAPVADAVFRALVDQSSRPMAVLNLDGYFLYVNWAFASLFGASVTPEHFPDVACATLLSDDEAAEFCANVLPRAAAEGWRGLLRLSRKDRLDAELRVRMSPVRRAAGSSEAPALVAEFVLQRQSLLPVANADERSAWQVPVLPVAHRIIVVPVVGELSARRANSLMRRLLAGITTYRAKAAIVDVTGLLEVDMRAADYLAKIVLAARLKGAKTIVSGVSQQTAEALTEINAEWKGIDVVGQLQAALTLALGRVETALEARRARSARGAR